MSGLALGLIISGLYFACGAGLTGFVGHRSGDTDFNWGVYLTFYLWPVFLLLIGPWWLYQHYAEKTNQINITRNAIAKAGRRRIGEEENE